jgi:hypothetical protein
MLVDVHSIDARSRTTPVKGEKSLLPFMEAMLVAEFRLEKLCIVSIILTREALCPNVPSVLSALYKVEISGDDCE